MGRPFYPYTPTAFHSEKIKTNMSPEIDKILPPFTNKGIKIPTFYSLMWIYTYTHPFTTDKKLHAMYTLSNGISFT